MKVGTKIRTLYEHSDTATIVKSGKGSSAKALGNGWYTIRFDDGGKLCCHESMMAIRND